MTSNSNPKRPNIVGTAEAAEILGIIPQSLIRRRNAGGMPATACENAAGPVWWTRDINALKRGGDPRKVVEQLDLLSIKEIADHFDKDKSQIGRWRRAGHFPPPCAELRSGPRWWREDITNFTPPPGRSG